MLNVATTRDYLKYTLTLAGLGFAYLSTNLAAKTAIFGLDAVALGPVPLAKLLICLLMAAFFLSTLFGVFAVSGTVRYENEMASVPPAAPGAAAPPPPLAATKALAATRRYTNLHLKTLILAFVGAAAFFVEGFLFPEPPAERCELAAPAAAGQPAITLAFDCTAEVAAAVVAQGGAVKP